MNRVDPQAWFIWLWAQVADHKTTRLNDLLLYRYAVNAA